MLAALSLTSDLGSGVAFEKDLRTCAAACAFAEVLDLDHGEQRTIFQAALLRGLGCTAYSSETAATLGDDRAFQRALKTFDRAHPERFVADFRRTRAGVAVLAVEHGLVEVAPPKGK